MTIKDALAYELSASAWWVGSISNPWAHKLIAKYFGWKVRRKFKAFKDIGLSTEIENQTQEVHIFHGGCVGCTQQLIHGIEFCKGCQYCECNWDLPDLSNEEGHK